MLDHQYTQLSKHLSFLLIWVRLSNPVSLILLCFSATTTRIHWKQCSKWKKKRKKKKEKRKNTIQKIKMNKGTCKPAYSCCKFIILSNSYLYKHKPKPACRTRCFLSKMVFSLCLSFKTFLFSYQSMRYFGGTFSSRHWRFFFPRSIYSPHC